MEKKAAKENGKGFEEMLWDTANTSGAFTAGG